MHKSELIEKLNKIEGDPLVFFREPYDESTTFALTNVISHTVADEFNSSPGIPPEMQDYFTESELSDTSPIIVLTV